MMMTARRLVYLVCVCVFASVLADDIPGCVDEKECGFIMDQNNKYLTCTTSACTFEGTASQLFSNRDPGGDQWQWRILNLKGEDLNQCLDREHCHSGSSNARMSVCSHCGAIHWQFDKESGRLAEDHNKNCLQSNGRIEHCSQSFASVKFVQQHCEVKSQTITDLKCKDQKTGGICGASFQPGTQVGASSQSDCNACQAAPNSTTHCEFSLEVDREVKIDTSFSSATEIGLAFGAKFEESAEVFKAEESVEVSVNDLAEFGTTTSKGTKTVINDACKAEILAGTRESVTANVLTGTIIGEFTATVTTKYDCPGKKDKVVPDVAGKFTIQNVPTQSVIGSCKPVSTSCDGKEKAAEERLLV